MPTSDNISQVSTKRYINMVGEEERQASDEIKRPTQESKSKTGNTNPTEFLACLDKKFSIYIFYCHREVAHNAISKTAGRDDIILFYNFFFFPRLFTIRN